MAKRTGKNEQQSTKYSLQDCERRPVTKSDKWCRIKSRLRVDMENHPAPHGYVVTIPFIPNQNTMFDGVGGRIIRSKKRFGNLLLQVIPKEYYSYKDEYGLGSFTRHEPKVSKKRRRKKKLYRIINIRNVNKRKGHRGQFEL